MELENEVTISESDALIVIDIQYDFVPGGALPVEKGDLIIPGTNKLILHFQDKHGTIVLTQDWHPPDHLSFASSHPGKSPFDLYEGEGLGPVLWPDHCVQGSSGANLHKDLIMVAAATIIKKGTKKKIDSYSAFRENDQKTETGLAGYLKSRQVKRIFLVGLALDFCVHYSAIDARDFDFETFVVLDLTKGIDNPEGSIAESIENMKKKGVKFVKFTALS